jgi:hypothetical protein
MATFQGLSFTNREKEFHDVLIVKTNQDNKIVDAYQYTLEWAEPPSACDLFKSSCKNLSLTNKMSVEKLKLVRQGCTDGSKQPFTEQGIVLFQ